MRACRRRSAAGRQLQPGAGTSAAASLPFGSTYPDMISLAWTRRLLARGRLDHFALAAPDAIAFEELRRRLLMRGSSGDGLWGGQSLQPHGPRRAGHRDRPLGGWRGTPSQIDMAPASDEELFRRRISTSACWLPDRGGLAELRALARSWRSGPGDARLHRPDAGP